METVNKESLIDTDFLQGILDGTLLPKVPKLQKKVPEWKDLTEHERGESLLILERTVHAILSDPNLEEYVKTKHNERLHLGEITKYCPLSGYGEDLYLRIKDNALELYCDSPGYFSVTLENLNDKSAEFYLLQLLKGSNHKFRLTSDKLVDMTNRAIHKGYVTDSLDLDQE